MDIKVFVDTTMIFESFGAFSDIKGNDTRLCDWSIFGDGQTNVISCGPTKRYADL